MKHIDSLVKAEEKNMGKAKLTTTQELLSRFKTTIVELTTGKVFRIRVIPPGDFVTLVGTPLLSVFVELGIDMGDTEHAVEDIQSLSAEKKMALVSGNDFQSMIRKIVCRAVISINFVDALQEECNTDRNEVPISVLEPEEQMEIYIAVMDISVNINDVKDFYSFREDGTDKEVERDDGEAASDSQNIRTETVRDAVPSQE